MMQLIAQTVLFALTFTTTGAAAQDFDELRETTAYHGSGGGPVWSTFMSALQQCAPGCVPENYNVYRSGATCHASGRAVDVHAIRCGGRLIQAIHGGAFASLVTCARRFMYVLFHDGPGVTSGHHDHAHFSIGCSIPGHPNYR